MFLFSSLHDVSGGGSGIVCGVALSDIARVDQDHSTGRCFYVIDIATNTDVRSRVTHRERAAKALSTRVHASRFQEKRHHAGDAQTLGGWQQKESYVGTPPYKKEGPQSIQWRDKAAIADVACIITR